MIYSKVHRKACIKQKVNPLQFGIPSRIASASFKYPMTHLRHLFIVGSLFFYNKMENIEIFILK